MENSTEKVQLHSLAPRLRQRKQPQFLPLRVSEILDYESAQEDSIARRKISAPGRMQSAALPGLHRDRTKSLNIPVKIVKENTGYTTVERISPVVSDGFRIHSPESPRTAFRGSTQVSNERRSRTRSLNTPPPLWHQQQPADNSCSCVASRSTSANSNRYRTKSASRNGIKQRDQQRREYFTEESNISPPLVYHDKECLATVEEVRSRLSKRGISSGYPRTRVVGSDSPRRTKSLPTPPFISEPAPTGARQGLFSAGGSRSFSVDEKELEDLSADISWSYHWHSARNVILENGDDSGDKLYPKWQIDSLFPKIGRKPVESSKLLDNDEPATTNMSLEERLARIEKDQGIHHQRNKPFL